ncbi:MAG: aminotransferase class III-fold pyridoxal phosphate-dependent enzyme, partial [Albidovulum sp.]|nr:aminotransferase class III-fold pyridoxal phosphate-dependent enzyme [Albidovulum sp.]
MNRFSESSEIYRRASPLVSAGVSSNTRARSPHPLYFRQAEGAWAWDADGNRHLDIVMGNGAVLLGHGHEAVNSAVAEAVSRGLTCGLESARAVDAIECLLSAAAWPDMARFTNTGTEAVQHAMHIARYATGRTRIAKIEGSYHGWSDEVFVSVWIDPVKAGPVFDITPLPQFAGQ